MINPENFKEMMALIADRTPNTPSASTLAIYYQLLSPCLDDKEFRESAMSVFQSTEFFPAPSRFLEIRSTRQWPMVMSVLQEFTPPNVPEGWADSWQELAEDSRNAIVQLGGPLAARGMLQKDVARLRRMFVETYEQVARDAAVEALGDVDVQPPLLESRE